jgi:CDP-diacylglycerol pyrophosphatase
MPDDKYTSAFDRREFMKLSGGAGAAAVVGMAAPGVVKALASPSPSDPNCGGPNDGGHLYTSAQTCKSQGAAGKNGCLAPPKITNYVVLAGAKAPAKVDHNKLLVPTVRVKGIECPKLWGTYQGQSLKGQDYWDHAWTEANTTGDGSVTVDTNHQRALGINSKRARDEPQLHIHMSEMTIGDVKALDAADSKGNVATKPADWFKPQFLVRVGGHDYRVLHVADLKGGNDPFVLLADRYGGSSAKMALQTLLVTSRKAGGFYVLNSNTSDISTKNGISTCDAKRGGLLNDT